MTKQYAVGLMSGTSVDGIDAALVTIEGSGTNTKVELVHFVTTSFSPDLKERIFQAMSENQSTSALICSLNFELGEVFANAVKQVCKEAHIPLDKLSFIGSHGQTIYHQPFQTKDTFPSTLQIGEPSIIAYHTKTKVVSNFRSMDMAAGGEGAPLVPYSDYLLYRSNSHGRALQNIGGIGNVTVLPKKPSLQNVFAFDTGPGNMVIDGLCERLQGIPFDKGGMIASKGMVHDTLAQNWLEWESDFFNKTPPKSTGREMFGEVFVNKIIQENHHLANEDLIATATYLTALSIANAYKKFVFPTHDIYEVIVAGGGSFNRTLLHWLRELLPHQEVKVQEDIGFSSEAKEAVAFALLANETLNGNPGNVPNATGASEPVILGSITPCPVKK
ncbi:anhydro-N-acetylmuramic acid kinase [Bacillus pakistanensis]|uniref:Anhydro-N-acetylmuramic acid kinase n=1 Tax=Rossellomorea pakistanensis TaxID=992288 RepID=A0ABS2NCQ6_9BACI|nr:anhydro-N-acetylmuramic acid kinase [Bacillus pakistanensis]